MAVVVCGCEWKVVLFTDPFTDRSLAHHPLVTIVHDESVSVMVYLVVVVVVVVFEEISCFRFQYIQVYRN